MVAYTELQQYLRPDELAMLARVHKLRGHILLRHP